MKSALFGFAGKHQFERFSMPIPETTSAENLFSPYWRKCLATGRGVMNKANSEPADPEVALRQKLPVCGKTGIAEVLLLKMQRKHLLSRHLNVFIRNKIKVQFSRT